MAEHYAIAIDIGTSGIRAQSYNLTTHKTISTAITLRHPLPGANVVDHLHFALNIGRETAHNILITTINRVIANLNIDLNKVERLAVCGNPIQLSLFNNIEIRDLAFWGENALKEKNITPPSRRGKILNPQAIGLDINPDAKIYIPPAIKHEIGADALAMLYKSKALEKDEYSLIIDFGTNAEMALIADGEIYTASAAAGPAIEGQNIEKGRLASPGVICDINEEEMFWRMKILNDNLIVEDGDLIDPVNGNVIKKSDIQAKGITGTGVIAAFSLGNDDKIIKDGKIKDTIYLQDNIYLKEKDISNIGKALGAFRAGQLTLAESADILLDEIESVYMAGASGFYVDAKKSLNIGQIPPGPQQVYQIGNTSLAMAKDIVLNPELLDELQKLADKIESNHIMLATSEIFEKIYSLELAIYEQGMPFWMYNQWLQKYGIQEIPNIETEPEITKLYPRDIADLGENDLNTVDIENTLSAKFDRCIYCMDCAEQMAILGSSLHELAGLECARIPFGLTVEAQSMGAEVNLGNNERTPEVTGTPFESADDIEAPDDFLENGRIPVVLEAIDILKEKYEDLPIIVGITGPFTLTGHLLGIENVVRYMKTDPDEIEIAMENCLDASMDYIESIQKHDADVICVNEPTASPELIDPLQFKSMIKPNLEDLADFIDVQKVLHICGSTQPIISDMSSVGFDGISIEEAVDIPKAKESIEDECVIVGNISTSKTLLSGTPEDVKEDVKKVLSEDIDIIAPSCGLAPKTPLANVKALVEARNEYFNI